MGIQVDTQTLRASVSMLAEAESEVRGHHPDKHLSQVSGALPGSSCEQAAGALQQGWSQDYAAWHKTADDHKQALHEAADTHDATDQGAQSAFAEFYGRVPR